MILTFFDEYHSNCRACYSNVSGCESAWHLYPYTGSFSDYSGGRDTCFVVSPEDITRK